MNIHINIGANILIQCNCKAIEVIQLRLNDSKNAIYVTNQSMTHEIFLKKE